MFLKIEIEDSESFTYRLAKTPITIGSSLKSNIIININSISRNHLNLIKEDNIWFIVDMGSTNGSFFQDQQLYPGDKQRINPNEFVRLGENVHAILLSQGQNVIDISNHDAHSPPEIKPELEEKTRIIKLKEMQNAEITAFLARRKELKAQKRRKFFKKIRKHLDVYLFFTGATILGFLIYWYQY